MTVLLIILNVDTQTPPRILTLDAHYFPSVDEDNRHNNTADAEVTPAKPRDHFNHETQTVARHVR